MPASRVRIVLFTFCAATVFAVCSASANAQGCSSCQTRPAAGYYQPTTAYQAPASAAPYYNGAGCNTCNQTVAQPVPAQPLYQRPVYRPIPRTSYRTEWLPTHVTNYTPSTAINPATGFPVTSYRACQTQRYQIQRVPTFGLFSSGSACNSGCGSPSYASPATAGCSSCGVAPTYAPATSIPYSTTPMTVSPGTSQPGAATFPGSTATPGPAPAPTNPTPAETRPSLKPQARTNAQGASIRDFNPQPSYDARDDSPSTVPSLDPPARSIRIRPVPDPDGNSIDEQPHGSAPQLLDPRQKTATRPTNLRASYTRVAWPQTNTLPARPPAEKATRPAVTRGGGGWKTVDW